MLVNLMLSCMKSDMNMCSSAQRGLGTELHSIGLLQDEEMNITKNTVVFNTSTYKKGTRKVVSRENS